LEVAAVAAARLAGIDGRVSLRKDDPPISPWRAAARAAAVDRRPR
jgi:hypothetical protein